MKEMLEWKLERKITINKGAPMKIVIAPDSFKESMTALQCATAIERGINNIEAGHDIIKIPMADGGEGTVQSLVDALAGEMIYTSVTGPLGKPVDAFYGVIHQEVAVIEIAAASGLDVLSEEERNPMNTTTYGTGELIMHALNKGIRTFIIGIGGSATNDGGIGMAQALGAEITDDHYQPVSFGGEGLANVRHIHLDTLDERLKECSFDVACDVVNPLVGQDGASYIYGPQKGADPHMVTYLDKAMENYGKCVKEQIGVDVLTLRGGGAAGGLGAALYAYLQANLQPGFDLVTSYIGLESYVQDADLVITGEGKIDDQTIYGKTPIGVAKIAKQYNLPVLAIGGTVDITSNDIYIHGVDAVFSILNKPMTLEDALQHAEQLTEALTENIWRFWSASPHSKA